MIEEGDISANALLTDDEIAVKSMRLGLKWHYPGRIRIQDILDGSFKCDWKRRKTITDLIVYYGLGKYADTDESDLLIDTESKRALESEDPIAYIKNLRQENRRPIIQATNAIVGDNNSGNNQGRDFEVFSPTKQPIASPQENAIKTDKKKEMSMYQFVFWLFSAFASGIAVGYMLFNILRK